MGIFDKLFGPPNVKELESNKDVEGLVKALKYEDKNVRDNAAWALGKIGDARAVNPLVAIFRDKNEHIAKRLGVVSLLRVIGSSQVIEAFMTAFEEDDDFDRLNVSEILHDIGDARVVKRLIVFLEGENRTKKIYAAKALGGIGGVRAVDPLIAALREKDTYIVRSAAKALGEIGDVKAVEPLIDTLKWRSKDKITSDSARDALIHLGSTAVESLTNALSNKNEYIRLGAAQVLGVIKDKRATKALIQVLEGPDGHAASAVSEADWRVGEVACWALGMIGDKSAIEVLKSIQKDTKSTMVKDAAEEALEKLGVK